jgi:hypothetical protein
MIIPMSKKLTDAGIVAIDGSASSTRFALITYPTQTVGHAQKQPPAKRARP